MVSRKCKQRIMEEARMYANLHSWASAESAIMAGLKDRRRFNAELIADSVVEVVEGAPKWGNTVEVDEITAEEWLDNYRFCDWAINWILGV